MDFEVNEEQRLFQRFVHDFVSRELKPQARETDEKAEFNWPAVKKMGPVGLLGLEVPEEYGGAAVDAVSAAIAIEEMGHIELIAERILFLGGDVEMVASEQVKKVQDVKKMLEMSRSMEVASAKDYNLWANECSANADAATRKIFEALVEDEERHQDQYEDEMDNIEKFGENYLVLQSIEVED